MGYKKRIFLNYRVRVRKGNPKSARRLGHNRCKVASHCGREMKSSLARRTVSEIKCATVNRGARVISSNKILADSSYIYFRVVMIEKNNFEVNSMITTRFFSN